MPVGLRPAQGGAVVRPIADHEIGTALDEQLEAVVEEAVWPPPATEKPVPPDPSRRVPFSDAIQSGRLDVADVVQPIYDEINELYDTDYEPIFK